jgi:hypothetical protein
MSSPAESVTFTIPRAIVPELPSLSQGLTDRMHRQLERNTQGAISAIEREELETLVKMAQFAQILAMAARGTSAE